MSIFSTTEVGMRGGALVAVTLLLGSVATADAQRTISGFARSDQSDVSGVAVTSGDQLAGMFADPGTVRGMSCPVAWGVRTTADQTHLQLASAELGSTTSSANPGIDAATQEIVLGTLTSDQRDSPNAARLLAALAPPQNREATGAARRLVRQLEGLFNVLQVVDPAEPGFIAATRLSEAVGALNTYVEASNADFLATPPPEFAAVRLVLNRLVIASLENEGRAVDANSVSSSGLACAGPVATVVPDRPAPPAPPVEHALEICVISEGAIRNVAALWRPEVGDTLALVGGERRPFASTYPAPAPTGWLALGDPVQIGTREYRPFGLSRAVRPGEMTYAGSAGGADFYSEGGTVEAVIAFPVGPGCMLQPYRAVETVRIRG